MFEKTNWFQFSIFLRYNLFFVCLKKKLYYILHSLRCKSFRLLLLLLFIFGFASILKKWLLSNICVFYIFAVFFFFYLFKTLVLFFFFFFQREICRFVQLRVYIYFCYFCFWTRENLYILKWIICNFNVYLKFTTI